MNYQNKIIKSNFLSFSLTSTVFVTAITLVVGGFFVANNVFATVTITSATNGTSISIDKTSALGGTSTWTSLTGPTITETTFGDIALGVHTIALPAGWEFNTAQNFTIAFGGATELTLQSQDVTPGATTLSFNVTNVSSTGLATLTFSNVQVRPTGTSSGTSGNITMTTGEIVGVDGTTNFGTLSTVAGNVTKLAFTTPPTNTVYGSNISTFVVNTQDQFSNNSTSGLTVSDNITLTLSAGVGALTGTTLLDIGTSGGSGTASYSAVQVDTAGTGKVITATSASGLTSVVSSSFDIVKATPTATLNVTNSGTYQAGVEQSAAVGVAFSSVPGSVDFFSVSTDGQPTGQINAGSYPVTANFVPDDATNYETIIGQATVDQFVINKATPTVTLSVSNSPTPYTGVAQSVSVATTTESIPGTVANILSGGAATQTNVGEYPVTANFVPTDTTNYETITAQSAGNFVINKVTPVITWANPADISAGTALSATQLNASATGIAGALDGSFVYSPASGVVLTIAGIQTLSTNFTPTDTTNYDSVNNTTVALNVISSASSGGSSGGGGGGGATISTTFTSPLSVVAQKVDANKDNKIDVLDFNSLMVNWGKTTANNVTDFNGDSKVDVFDFNLLMINWTL